MIGREKGIRMSKRATWAGLVLSCCLPLAAQPPACKLEIASVRAFKGTWRDEKHKRVLIANLPICDDSRLVRVRDNQASGEDFLILKNRRGEDLPAYQCRYLLGCETPLDLSDIARESQRQLQGRSAVESFME